MAAKKKVSRPKVIAIEPTSKIVPLKGAENPFREGSAVAKRVNAVLSARRVDVALKKGARKSTIRACLRAKLIRIA
jgi:hypothetical protein